MAKFTWFSIRCPECDASDKKLLSIEDIEHSYYECSKCKTITNYKDFIKQTKQDSFSIGREADWRKKVPDEFRNFMNEFKSRHGSDSTIDLGDKRGYS